MFRQGAELLTFPAACQSRSIGKSMKDLRLKYTAKFKRDYVAWTAVVIFFLIVASELFLAVWLPVSMRRESALAVSVRRLRLVESFDNVRYRIKALAPKTPNAKAEVGVLRWNLDLMAGYMRSYVKYLSGDELAVLQQQLNEFDAAISYLSRGKAYSKQEQLDCSVFVEQVMKKSGVGNVR